MPAINQSPKYRKFIEQRDRALEQIHRHAQKKITFSTRKYLTQVLFFAKNMWISKKSDETEWFEHHMVELSERLKVEIAAVYWQMKRASYMLANSGEAEAIGRALGRKTKFNLPSTDSSDSSDRSRISQYVNKLRRDLTTAVERAVINRPESEKVFLQRIKSKFPKTISIDSPRRVLKKPIIKESDDDPKDPMATGFVNEFEWEDLVSRYMDEYVPDTRGPESSVIAMDGDQIYAWELERDATHAFIQAVRDGQIDAANENGISDFVWIAILDDRTDECCEWRDGLTSKEIEAELSSKHEGDECDAIVPPAHFNCRCTLAPVTDDLPDKPESNEMEFEDWLNT